jgi:hypothetical protein
LKKTDVSELRTAFIITLMRPLHRDHFWCIVRPHLISKHSWFVHQSSGN